MIRPLYIYSCIYTNGWRTLASHQQRVPSWGNNAHCNRRVDDVNKLARTRWDTYIHILYYNVILSLLLLLYTWDDDNNIQNGRGHGDDGRHNTTSLSRRRRHMNASHLYRRSCIDDMHRWGPTAVVVHVYPRIRCFNRWSI